jgi:hypothetical protein
MPTVKDGHLVFNGNLTRTFRSVKLSQCVAALAIVSMQMADSAEA